MIKKIILLLLIFFILISYSCSEVKQSPFAPGKPFSLFLSIFLGLQNKPSFSPSPGKFTEAVTLKISNSKNNPGLPIHYTIDGSAPSCSSPKYDSTKGVLLDLGRIYTVNAVECFEGISSALGSSGEYAVGFCQNYSGISEGRLLFIKNQFASYSPTPIEGTYKYSISPSLNSCILLNSDSGIISGTCPNTISEQEYRISRVLQTGSKETFSCFAKIVVAEWTNEAYLKAPNAEGGLPGDFFGYSVSISGDTIVVGAEQEDSNETTITNGTTSAGNGTSFSGAAYVFRRTGTTWSNEAYLKAPNAELNDGFGTSVSISGDTIVVGTFREDSLETTITNGTLVQATDQANARGVGAAYVFRRTGTTWTNEAYLKAPNADGAATEVGDDFGWSVAISGDTIVIGADEEDSLQTTITNGTLVQASDQSSVNVGAAYVFRRTGTTWANEAYLKAPNAETGDKFGWSVAIFEDTIVIGAPNESSNQTTITNGTTASSNNSASQSGAAYVFRRTGTTWTNEAYLKAPNAEGSDNFGGSTFSHSNSAVAIYGDTIVVGASFEDSNQTTITNGTSASSNNTALDSGAAYVFRRTGTIWSIEAYLKAPNAEGISSNGDEFGNTVAIFGDLIVVGAHKEDSLQTTITNGTLVQSSDVGSTNSGAAYVFRRSGTTWVNEAYLKAPNAEAGDNFGFAVSVSSDTIVIGALREDSNQTTITNGTTASSDNSAGSSGAAYVFRLR